MATRWVYYSGFYDGPLSGVVRTADETRAWAKCAQECSCYDEVTDEGQLCGFYRRYQLYSLTSEAWAVEDEKHADFQRWVGTHWDFDESGQRHRNLRPQDEHAKFYDKWPPARTDNRLDGATPIGWFVR